MIVYIHGFGSSGESNKAVIFKDFFKTIGEKCIAPSLSYIPDLAVQTLEELVNACDEKWYVIGSSLGGYYATYLAQHARVEKVVLINPSVDPKKTLRRVLGEAHHYYDGSYFAWNETHLSMLERFETNVDAYKEKFMVLLQTGDEVLDYREAVAKYAGSEVIVEEGGEHGFDGIERYLDKVRRFFEI